MSNRAFGVEIECYAPQPIFIQRTTMAARASLASLDYPGPGCDCEFCVEYRARGEREASEQINGDTPQMLEIEYPGPNHVKTLLRENGFAEWANLTTGDSSLTSGPGVEIKSPILTGKNGFDELNRMFNFLNEQGFWVDECCGMHVHHDAPEYYDDFRLTMRLVKSWKENQHLIANMVDSERLDNEYCPEWTDDEIQYHEDEGHFRNAERNSLNVASLRRHQSIEIRLHEGTMNYEEAESWIKFGQSFIDSVSGRRRPLKPLTNEELLMRRIKVEKNAARFLTTKAERNKRSIWRG